MSDRSAEQVYRHAATSCEQISLLDARLLMCHCLGLSLESLIADPDRTLTIREKAGFTRLIERRAAGEPVSQILQHKEFWGLPFHVSGDVLTPRPDTETLVELVVELCRAQPPQRILDIGTGSGCLLAALLHEFPEATGLGLDISAPALAIARRNLTDLGFADRSVLKQANFCEPIAGTYDLVVSNPPYIASADRPSLPVDVREYEPAIALFAGDGYDAYRAIAQQLPRLLSSGGRAVVEIGQGQETVVRTLFEDSMTAAERTCSFAAKADLAGIQRAVAVLG